MSTAGGIYVVDLINLDKRVGDISCPRGCFIGGMSCILGGQLISVLTRAQ